MEKEREDHVRIDCKQKSADGDFSRSRELPANASPGCDVSEGWRVPSRCFAEEKEKRAFLFRDRDG